MYEKVLDNKSLKLIVDNDGIVINLLEKVAEKEKVRLGPYFENYTNIFELYWYDIENSGLKYEIQNFQNLESSEDILKQIGL